MYEETRPQSAKTLKQDHEISIKDRPQGLCVLQMFYSFQMLGEYMHHRAPLSFPPFGSFFLINHFWSAHTCQEPCLVLRFREDRWTYSREIGRLTEVQNLLDPQAKRAQVDPEAVLYLMYEVKVNDKIRYGYKVSLSVPIRGGNHTGEHHIKKKQNHITKSKKPFSDQLHMELTGRREATKQAP